MLNDEIKENINHKKLKNNNSKNSLNWSIICSNKS